MNENFTEDTLEAVHNIVVEAYSAPGRYYHTTEHLDHCFNELAECSHLILDEDKPIITWALAFHDYVYKPTSKNNELYSGVQAEYILQKHGYTEEQLTRIQKLIYLTDHQESTWDMECEDDYLEKLVVDIDMSIIGAIPSVYRQYIRNIEREYSPFCTKKEFKEGRIVFLEDMNKREYLFRSLYFRDKYETRARKNIKDELTYLNGTP